MIDIAGDGAVLSDCGTFRWRLDRHVGAGDVTAAVFGVNPSSADASLDDPTVRKWRGFGRRLGWQRSSSGMCSASAPPMCAPWQGAADPFGGGHHQHLQEIIVAADVLIPCWGDRAKLPRALRPHLNAAEVKAALADRFAGVRLSASRHAF